MKVLVIIGAPAAVAVLGAWLRLGVRPVVVAYRAGVVIGRMLGSRAARG